MGYSVLHQESVGGREILLVLDQGRGLGLLFGGQARFFADEEWRHSETLAVVPSLFSQPKRVLILGGEDGLVVSRLLCLPLVERITVVEACPAIGRLARRHPLLRALNRNSLSDPKVDAVAMECRDYVFRASIPYDLVICDLPDPENLEQNGMYTSDFYEGCASRLGDHGVLFVRSTFEPSWFGILSNTLRTVFPFVRPARGVSAHPPVYGYHLAARTALEGAVDVPGWVDHLDKAIIESPSGVGKKSISVFEETRINTRENGLLARELCLSRHLSAAPHRYDRHTLVVSEDASESTLTQFCDAIETVNLTSNLIVYVHSDNKTVVDFLRDQGFCQRDMLSQFRVDLSSKTTIESIQRARERYRVRSLSLRFFLLSGSAEQHQGLQSLVERYLIDHQNMLVDGFGSTSSVLKDEADYHYYEDDRGKPVGFIKVIVTPWGREAEIVYGCGTARENIALILHSFVEEAKSGYETVEMNAPYPYMVSILRKLAIPLVAEQLVMVAPRRAGELNSVHGQRGDFL